jgi:hypothetical protein
VPFIEKNVPPSSWKLFEEIIQIHMRLSRFAEHRLDGSRKIDVAVVPIPREPVTRDIQGDQDKFINQDILMGEVFSVNGSPFTLTTGEQCPLILKPC